MEQIVVGVVSLGCDKNRVDTEVMLAKLIEGGYTVTQDPSLADVIIVNTCAFLESSRREAIETVIEMAHHKSERCKGIIVTGCLGQKYGDEVFSLLSEADAVCGINDYDSICDTVQQVLRGNRLKRIADNSRYILQGDRVLTTPSHYAYLKIGDGCDNFCSYCLIPYIRGRFRSRKMEDITDEARKLVESGVRELILVAQDVTKYGADLYGKPSIVALIRRLSEIEDLKWIRLLYCYPELVDDELLREITENDKVVKYIDIPLQHVDDFILKKMNRRCSEEDVYRLFDKINSLPVRVDVRTTFICGFPFETEQTHNKVKEFLKRYRLRNVGFFAYSREKGTAAYNMPQQVHHNTKKRMVDRLYRLQHDIAVQLNRETVGTRQLCIVDEKLPEEGTYIGRTQFMAPVIDGVIYIHSDKQLTPGQFITVNVTGEAEYDLFGEVCENEFAK